MILYPTFDIMLKRIQNKFWGDIMQEKEKKKIVYSTALYIRLSKADERKGADRFSESIENQQIILHDYIDSNNEEFIFYKEYIDDGITGTNDLMRPAFMEMIKDLKDGKINCIIVKDLSRFARNHLQAGSYLQKTFQRYKVRFIALFDNYDTLGKNGYNFEAALKNIMNEDYSRRLSRNLIESFKIRSSKGQFIGAFPSYGYIRDPANKNHLIVDEEVRPVIEFIFAQFLDGVGKNTIAKRLNDKGIVCPSVYKQQQGLNYKNYKKLDSTNSWTYSTIQRILKNRVYCGDLVQHKTNHSIFNETGSTQYDADEWVLAEDCHEPIIDKKTFDKVQERLKTATRDIDFTQNISIFAGHIKCKECGRAMAKIQTKYKDKISTRYVCRSYKSNGEEKKICTSHSINEDVLKEFILFKLNEQLQKYRDLERTLNDRKNKQIKSKASEFELHIKELKKSLEKINEQIGGFYDMMAEVRKDPEQKRVYEEFLERVNLKREERDRIETELKKCEEKLSADPKLNLNNPVVKDLMKHKKFTELSKEIMDSFVSTVYVHEEFENNAETNKQDKKLLVDIWLKFEELK